MEMAALLERLAAARGRVSAWRVLPPRPGRYAPLPGWLAPGLAAALRAGGIVALYEHQHRALAVAREGRNVLVVTPTASGKSLCHHLPVLQALLDDPRARALYVYPAKALAHDQAAALRRLAAAAGVPAGAVVVYDGDSDAAARRAAPAARIVLSNPEMIHWGLLPGHARWSGFLRGLRYVVLDELHCYRGVFGAHMAHILRRLKRLCRHYGSCPRFLSASATIANPADLALALLGEEAELVAGDGSPSGEKHFLIVNPYSPGAKGTGPLLDAAAGWTAALLAAGRATVAFARSRLEAELLHRRVRVHLEGLGRPGLATAVYRGGFRPRERREIERSLRSGRLAGVVSTSALELGVDVGTLDACVLCGFPGSLAATWQRAGRAGRQGQASAAVLVAGPQALDQYLARHPEHLFCRPAEAAAVNPDNPRIAAWHRAWALRELPDAPVAGAGGRPAGPPRSLRSSPGGALTIVRAGDGTRLGDASLGQAPSLAPGVVHWHQGDAHRIVSLDIGRGLALARPCRIPAWTATRCAAVVTVAAPRATRIHLLSPAPGPAARPPRAFEGWGPCRVTLQPLPARERDEQGRVTAVLPVAGPAVEFATDACWIGIDAAAAALVPGHATALALRALAHLLEVLLPLYLLADPRDVGTAARSPAADGSHVLFVYDRHEGGSGCAALLFSRSREVLAAALELVARCPCADGCPLCTGPARPRHAGAPARPRLPSPKEAAGSLLRLLASAARS